ncbi:MAG: dienelactone hydrolase family protein [Pseudomonadota bacterium]
MPPTIRFAALAVLALALASGCTSRAAGPPPEPAPPTTETQGRVGLATASPYDFADFASASPAVIEGDLSLPQGEIQGAVILSHGAGGRGSRQTRMAEWLNERGWAALTLDHFGPRGIGSTVRDQLRATEQTMLADLLAARAWLAAHPRLEGRPLGVFGWSKGATTAVLASVERFAGFAGEARFDFAVAFYPFCGFALDGERLAAPLLMLLGAEDDWTPTPPCVRQSQAWAAAGQPVEHVVYEGAEHGFDARTLFSFTVGRAITVRDTTPACTLAVDGQGRSGTLDGVHSLASVEGRVAFLEDCGERGVTFGGDSAARRAAYVRIEAFLGARGAASGG